MELRRLFNGQVCRLRALKNLADVAADATPMHYVPLRVAEQTPALDRARSIADGGQAVPKSELRGARRGSDTPEYGAPEPYRIRSSSHDCAERILEIVNVTDFRSVNREAQ